VSWYDSIFGGPGEHGIRRLGAAEDSPWYQPEIGRHHGDFPDGYRAVNDFVNQSSDRVDAAQRAANQALGIRRPTPHPGVGGGRMETGHHVKVNLDYPSETWYAAVSPPSWPSGGPHNSAYLHLGHDDAQVPHMLMRRLMHPHVQQWLGQTMDQ
jgi:hypothetical protein